LAGTQPQSTKFIPPKVESYKRTNRQIRGEIILANGTILQSFHETKKDGRTKDLSHILCVVSQSKAQIQMDTRMWGCEQELKELLISDKELKELLTSDKVLANYDPTRPIRVYVDDGQNTNQNWDASNFDWDIWWHMVATLTGPWIDCSADFKGANC